MLRHLVQTVFHWKNVGDQEMLLVFVISLLLFQKSEWDALQIYRNFSFTLKYQPKYAPIRMNMALNDTCFLMTQ